MEIENEFIMSQDGYASIDFTLLDRPNNNIASAPEATAVLLPDGHATDASFPSFDLLDGSGVVSSYGYAREGEDNQSLEQSRDGSEKELYKEQAMRSSADNGVAASNVEYSEYQIPQPVPKPVSSVDFFAKNQAPQQQEQQSQLTLFGSDGGEENQEFFESGQASQQSQPTGNTWWAPDNDWVGNNGQRDQSQVFNWAGMTEEQRRSSQLKMGGPQSSSEYPGALYPMPQAVNNDPGPSMYSFLPTNTHQMHKMPQQADGGLNAARIQGIQSSTGKSPQYDFQGLLNGSGYNQSESLAQNMGLSEQQRYRAMMHEREQQMRMIDVRNREQLLIQEASNREQQLREQHLRQQQLREQQLRMQEASSREHHLREQHLREQQLREQQIREQHLREQQLREQQIRIQEANREQQQLRLKEANSREQLRMQEASNREQHPRLQGQQNQSFSKYENQNMEVSPLKVSDYDFLGGAEYAMKGQPQSEVRQQLSESDAQLWRQQLQQQQQQQRQPRQFSTYANNNYEDLHQRQQAQVRQRLQHHAQQQQLFAGSQNQPSGNQFQAFLGEGSLQDLPQVMQHQSERVNSHQPGAEEHHPFVPPNVQAVNQNSAGGLMYAQNEAGAGQGPINYLLGQDNSFSWHQLAIKASALDQPMHVTAGNSSKAGQQSNPYANVHDGGVPGYMGGMGKHPAPGAQINRPIPRSLGAGPSPLFGMEGRLEGPDLHASKSKMLFGQAMQQQQQQQQPPQTAKHMQGFVGNSQQGNFNSRQVLEAAQRRRQQSLSGHPVQQDGAPPVKLFAQSLTSMDPMQQQHNLMAANRNAQSSQVRHANILQQSALNMTPERNHLTANPGHHYQQGVNQAGVSFLQSASDRKQQPMWNNYEMEAQASQVEVPVMLPGNSDSLLKSNCWPSGSEGHGVPDGDSSLAFERSKMQQNVWGVHGAQPSNSQSSGDGGPRHHTPQGGAVQQGTPKPSGGHPLAAQANGAAMHQSSLQSGPSMLELSELEANGRQQELQNSQEETNWRNHSLLQASPQQSGATNSSLQAFTETDRPQTSWKSLWQSVQNPGNSSQLAETDKGQQSALWGQNNSNLAGPQPELSDGANARMALNGWSGAQGTMQADASGESQQTARTEQHVMLSGSPQPVQGFQDVEGRQHLSNQGPSFQEALSQASLSDNDPSSASQHIDQGFQNASSFAHPVDRDGNVVNSSDAVGQSSSSKDSINFSKFPVDHQTSLNKGNLHNQGQMIAWNSDTRQRFNDTSVPLLDNSGQQEGRVQLQLSSQQIENRHSSIMNARAANMQEEFSGPQSLRTMNAMSGYGHQNNNERAGLLNGATEDGMAGWAQSQMAAANRMRVQQSKLAGRSLQTGNMVGNAGKEHFSPSRPGSAGDDQTSYTNSILAHRARYSGRRDVVDPGRNTLELLNRTEQGEEITDTIVDQDGSAPEDSAGPAATSLAHLRPGPMGGPLLQRPTPSRPELLSREQMEIQPPRNMENWHQGRNLMQDYTREDVRAYAQSQMQSQIQSQMQAQMQAQVQAQSIRAAQLQAENMPRPGQMQERMSAFLGANRLFPNDMSRQTAANIYKNLSDAAKLQFRQQLQQQQRANQLLAQQNQRASVAGPSMDPSNMSGMDPRMAAQQHMSRVGYPDRPAMPAGMSPEQQLQQQKQLQLQHQQQQLQQQHQSKGTEMVAGLPHPADGGLPQGQSGPLLQLQQSKQATAIAPLIKKRKEYPPLVPWRTTITQGSTNLPTTSRAEMEWAAATNSLPDQERFNDAVETLDVTAMCVKRAKRRLKFTTQLMQQLVPALPCQLFKGSRLDDYKSATFVLAKFAVSEACWYSTGFTRETSGAVATDGAENSNGNVSIVKSDQQIVVANDSSSPALSSELRIKIEQKLAEFQNDLSRMDRAPTASKLSREFHDLDKLVVLNRMAKIHGSEFLAGSTNPTGSPRGKTETRSDAPVVYSPETAYPERFVAAVFVPQTIPENMMLLQL